MSKKYPDARILITGGAGLVGSFIVDQLLREKAQDIVVVDNLIRGKTSNIQPGIDAGNIRFVEGDIRDTALLDKCFEGVDYCFHLAALRITHCAAEQRHALEVMYDGTFNVLEACVKHHVPKIIFASTASVYGQASQFPTKEDQHPYANVTLYGAAKMADELMMRAFAQMHPIDFTVLRFFNIYGPRMDVHGKYTEVLIRWYRMIKEGKRPLIFGDGKQTMDFIYVADIARACLLAMRSKAANEVFNIASGVETSLEQLCRTLLKVMGSDLEPEFVAIPHERQKVEVLRRWADVSKARDIIGFQSEVGLEDGLKRLVDWLDQLA